MMKINNLDIDVEVTGCYPLMQTVPTPECQASCDLVTERICTIADLNDNT